MRLGIFGGTFDPVHFGHLLLAEYCREQLSLDAVWFMPAAVPPHKQGEAIAPAEARVEMLQLAVGGHEAFHICRRELDRGGVSYTHETLAAIQAEDPRRTLFMLMGGDSLRDLPTWREPARICQLAIPVAVQRPDSPPPEAAALAPFCSCDRLEEIRRHAVSFPRIELSSREIRRRAAAGLSIRYQTPRAVEQYICAQGLYRPR